MDTKNAIKLFNFARSLSESPMVFFEELSLDKNGSPKVCVGMMVDTSEFSNQFDFALDFMTDQLIEQGILRKKEFKTIDFEDGSKGSCWTFNKRGNIKATWGKIKGTNIFYLILTDDDKYIEKVVKTTKATSILANKKHNKFVAKVTYGNKKPQMIVYSDPTKHDKLVEKLWEEMKNGTQPASMDGYQSSLVKYMKFFGARRSQAFVAKVFAEGKGFVTKTKSFAKEGQSLKDCGLTSKGITAADIKIAPKDSSVFARFKIKPETIEKILLDFYTETFRGFYRTKTDKEMSDEFDASMTDVAKLIGFDPRKAIKEQMVGGVSLISAESLGGKLTGTVLAIDIKDEAEVKKCIDKIFASFIEYSKKRINRPCRQPKILETSQGKTKIYYLSMAHWSMLPINISYALKNNKLYLATYPQVLQSALTKKKTSIADNKKFAKIYSKIGKDAQMMFYLDVQYIIRELYPLALTGATELTNLVRKETRGMLELPLIPAKFSSFWKSFSPEFRAVKVDEEGLEINTFSTLPDFLAIGANLWCSHLKITELITYNRKIEDVNWGTANNLVTLGKLAKNNRKTKYTNWNELVSLEGQNRNSRLRYSLKSFKSPASNNPCPAFIKGKDGSRTIIGIKGCKDYILIPNNPQNSDNNEMTIMIYENPANWNNKGTYVIYNGGGVDWLEMKEFKKLLKRSLKAANSK